VLRAPPLLSPQVAAKSTVRAACLVSLFARLGATQSCSPVSRFSSLLDSRFSPFDTPPPSHPPPTLSPPSHPISSPFFPPPHSPPPSPLSHREAIRLAVCHFLVFALWNPWLFSYPLRVAVPPSLSADFLSFKHKPRFDGLRFYLLAVFVSLFICVSPLPPGLTERLWPPIV